MGLSASMYASVSGLLTHGNKMSVVGNNIANVSTIGFKSQRMDFNDYLYLNGGSSSGPTQIGAGVSTYAVLGDFSQGSLESTNSGTDLAIDGEGFFKVRQPNTEQMYYTRAGDFYFNADRQLQNPEGYRLQGWKVPNDSSNISFKKDSINLGKNETNESPYMGTGTPQDIVLDSWYLQPQRTSSVKFVMGLTNKDGYDRLTVDSKPMTALFNQWDGRKDPPIADADIASSSIKVYDEAGTAHTMTVYYDQVSTDSNRYSFDGMPAGYSVYEYIVTIPPAEDNRSYGGTDYDAEENKFLGEQPKTFQGTQSAGLLMTGHLIFDAGGNLVNQTAFSYGGNPELGATTSVKDKDGNVVGILGADGTFNLHEKGYIREQAIDIKDKDGNIITTVTNDRGIPSLTALPYGYSSTTTAGGATIITKKDEKGDDMLVAKIASDGKVYPETENGYSTTTYNNIYDETGTIKLGTAKDGDIILTAAGEDRGLGVAYSARAPKENDQYAGDPTDMSSWQSTKFSSNGVPVLCANFSGMPLANSVCEYNSINNPQVEKYLTEVNFGMRNLGGDPNDWSGSFTNLSQLAGVPGKDEDGHDVYYLDYSDITKFTSADVDAESTKTISGSTVTQDAIQNGYSYGVLSGTNITNDGVVYGYYDNGETVPLYQIALYDFHNKQGLRREGGNLYAETRESGSARQGVAGDNGFGVTRAYNIEGSNVDLSRELVNMITTQRGFQANSKGITTVDTMLETVIGMKR